MKKFIFALMALVCIFVANAQNQLQCATLQHGDSMTIFNGTDGFANAYNAAVDGDVITLSGGEFSMPANNYISKAIRVYGAGFETDEETGTEVTKLSSQMVIIMVSNFNSQIITGLHLEGLYINGAISISGVDNAIEKLKDFTLKKCYVNGSIYNTIDTIENAVYDQCVITGAAIHDGYSAGDNEARVIKSMLIKNCYLGGAFGGYNADLSFIMADHCISKGIFLISSNQGKKVYWSNSIFLVDETGSNRGPVGTLSVVKNCLARRDHFPGSVSVENLYVVYGLSDIFTDANSVDYSPTRTFELQQPETWLGDDGTQVGLHGGGGWSKVSGIPVVKDLQLSVEGSTLNVTYEAEAR